MYDAVIPQNPNYKEAVGDTLYPFVQQLANMKAPRVMGMILQYCTIEDIRLILKDHRLLVIRVGQALEEIEKFLTVKQ